ncbi:MAG: hypothetical protein IJR52_09020 [Selenomonadaceae bacterium]|nr:hypothetical protein [Selenomonadaceae bacterium]
MIRSRKLPVLGVRRPPSMAASRFVSVKNFFCNKKSPDVSREIFFIAR